MGQFLKYQEDFQPKSWLATQGQQMDLICFVQNLHIRSFVKLISGNHRSY